MTLVYRYKTFHLVVVTDDHALHERLLPYALNYEYHDERGLHILTMGLGLLPAVQPILQELGVTPEYAEVDEAGNRTVVPALTRRDRFTLAAVDQDAASIVHRLVETLAGPILIIASGDDIQRHFGEGRYLRGGRVTVTTPAGLPSHDDNYTAIIGFGHLRLTDDVYRVITAKRSAKAISVLDFNSLVDFGLVQKLTPENERDRRRHLHFFGPVVRADDIDMPPTIETYASTPGFELVQPFFCVSK